MPHIMPDFNCYLYYIKQSITTRNWSQVPIIVPDLVPEAIA